ncbi:MAG: RNA-binding S4 domain-containing protein [Clostridiales bacterium]|nr:MAG: RNA-binding S4 domain-containing protein [Clostridiales bacterium]
MKKHLLFSFSSFLKFADVVEEGADAKILIQEGYVALNGETETRRGKKIYYGDEVFNFIRRAENIVKG